MRKEQEIQTEILKFLNAFPRCRAVKFNSMSQYSRRGEPDIIGSMLGNFLAIEVKKGTEEPTKLQSKKLALWKHAFAFTYSVNEATLAAFKIEFEKDYEMMKKDINRPRNIDSRLL